MICVPFNVPVSRTVFEKKYFKDVSDCFEAYNIQVCSGYWSIDSCHSRAIKHLRYFCVVLCAVTNVPLEGRIPFHQDQKVFMFTRPQVSLPIVTSNSLEMKER